jgi:hypothetical protein
LEKQIVFKTPAKNPLALQVIQSTLESTPETPSKPKKNIKSGKFKKVAQSPIKLIYADCEASPGACLNTFGKLLLSYEKIS